MKKLLLGLARRKSMGRLIGFAFAHCSGILPVRRVAANKSAVCFDHPVPCYDRHLLILPRRAVASLLHIWEEALLPDIVRTAVQASRLKLGSGGRILLCANGGCRQEVKQLHFHLYAQKHGAAEELLAKVPGTEILHGPTHLLTLKQLGEKSRVEIALRDTAEDDPTYALLTGMAALLRRLDAEYGIEGKGYSLPMRLDPNGNNAVEKVWVEF